MLLRKPTVQNFDVFQQHFGKTTTQQTRIDRGG